MRRILAQIAVALLICTGSFGIVRAQPLQKSNVLQADAGFDRSVKVGSEIVFDASTTVVPQGTDPIYKWDMGNGGFRFGLRPIYSYDLPGVYQVKLEVSDRDNKDVLSTDEVFVEVFEQQAILLARGADIGSSALAKVVDIVTQQNIAVETTFVDGKNASEMLQKSQGKNLLLAQKSTIERSDLLVVIDRFALELLLEYQNIFPEDIEGKQILFIVPSSSVSGALIDLAQLSYNVMNPDSIIVHSLDTLSDDLTASATVIIEERNPRLTFGIIDVLYQLNSRLIEFGADIDMLYLVYILLLVGIFGMALRKILGLHTASVHTLSLSVLAFFYLGLWFGLFLFTLATLAYFTIRRVYKTEYMTIFSTQFLFVGAGFLVSLIAIIAGRIFYPTMDMNLGVFFSVLLILISAYRLALNISADKLAPAFGKFFQDILFVVIILLIFSSEQIRLFVLLYTEMYILIVLISAIAIGKYTGLRLTELIRFQSLIKDTEEE